MDFSPGVNARQLLTHKGSLSLQDSERLFERMREMVDSGQLPRTAFRVVLELVQNLRIHGGGCGSAQVWEENEQIFVRTENETESTKAQETVDFAKAVNAAADRLPEEIRKRRTAPLPKEAKGAGLGMMEIRRLCNHDLHCVAQPMGTSKSRLVITAVMAHKTTK